MAANGADQRMEERPPLFAHIRFHIILSEKLDDAEANAVGA